MSTILLLKNNKNKEYVAYIYIYTHTQWNVTQPSLKNEILPFAIIWMDLEGMILSKMNQTEKDKYHMISLICGM